MPHSPSDDANDPGASTEAWFGLGRFALFLGILILAAFPDVILGGRTFFYRDFGIFGYPLAHYHRESFWRGEIPLWNPLNNCGLPFLAQWNTMVLYPGSLFYLLLPLSWSLGLFCLLHLFWAGLGMYLLAHRWSQHRLAACLAGLVFAFSGLALSCLKWPNNIAALAWMPWVFWLAERGWQEGGRLIVFAALAGAMQMLTGGPEITLFTWLLIALLWCAELVWGPEVASGHLGSNLGPCVDQNLGSCSGHNRVQVFFRLVGIIALVTGLTSAQMLPFLDLLVHSQRDAAYSDASWSMPLWGWANFLVPLFHCFPSYHGVFAQVGQYWVSSYYVGIGTLVLASVAFWGSLQAQRARIRTMNRRSRREEALTFGRGEMGLLTSAPTRGFMERREPRVWLLVALALVSLVLALGPDGHLYGWVRSVFPAIQVVRFPIKFVVVAVFIFPLLAAWALAGLDRASGESGRTSNSHYDCRRRGHESHFLEKSETPHVVSYRETEESHQNENCCGGTRPLLVLGSVCLGLIGIILWLAKSQPLPTDQWSTTWQSALSRGGFLVLIVGVLVFLQRTASRQRRVLLGCGLLVLVGLDLLSHAPRLNPTVERWVYDPGLAKAELKLNPEPKLGGTRALVSPWADFRLNHLALTNAVDDYLYSRMSLFANCNLVEGMPKIDGFFSLYIREESQVRSLLYASTNTSLPGLASFLGVSQATAPGKMIEWSVQAGPLPLATAGQKPEFADEPTVLRALAEPSLQPAGTVYLPLEARSQVKATNAAKAKVSVVSFNAHRIELAVDAATNAWVVLAQAFYHPWRAYLDGQSWRLWRANQAFQGVEVPAGRHTVRLVYEDRLFRVGAVSSILSVVICLAILFWARKRESGKVAAQNKGLPESLGPG